MTNPRIALTLAGVFLAGVGTGMVGMRYGLHERMHPQTVASVPANQDALLKRYQQELKLSPDQTKQLSAVLSDYEHYYASVQEQIDNMHLREQIEDVRATGKSRILEILTPEQKVQFEKMTVSPELEPVDSSPAKPATK